MNCMMVLGVLSKLIPVFESIIADTPDVRQMLHSEKLDFIMGFYKCKNGQKERFIHDSATESGSFLLDAYQYLLDWRLRYYLSHNPQSHTRGKNPPLIAAEGGEYRLTTDAKKRILTSCVYGVDIDTQAVEVTKLSLLLKLLEGETGQLSLGFERVLPDLGQNIRYGNSLIDWDYFKGQIFPDEEEIQRVNPFDWKRAFPHVFAEGGFDAVIGNPPYIRQELLGDDKRYYQNTCEVFTGTADIYSYFIEKGVRLLAPGGQFSYIVANKWMRANYGFKLREWLKSRCIEEITDFGYLPVFTGATTYPLIFCVSNREPHNRTWVRSTSPHYRNTLIKTAQLPTRLALRMAVGRWQGSRPKD